MKRIVIVLNGKGGVGKSFFAVNLVQFLVDQQVPHLAVDTDNENSTLKRFHPDALFLDLSEPRQLDGLFEALDRTSLVVCDGRAASTDLFLDYFTEIGLPAVLSTLDAAVTLAIPINHEADSVDQLQRLADGLGPAAGYVIVRNSAHSERFGLYERLEIRAKVLGPLGAREIEMPRLHDWLVEALNASDLTIGKALVHPAINLMNRQRLKHWQRRFYAQLETARPLLLPSEDV